MTPTGGNGEPQQTFDSERNNDARSIRASLMYLADEAFKLKLRFTGYLIGAAAESIENKEQGHKKDLK